MNPNKWEYSLLDYISVGVCIIDKDYKVIYWNEYLEGYTGISSLEITNKALFIFFPAFEDEIYRERVDNIFIGWPPVILSSRLHNPFFISKNHELNNRFQEITIAPIPTSADSTDFNAIFTITDVTDITKKLEEQNILYKKAQEEIEIRKAIQKNLKESKKNLKELVLTKDKFFSIIAHDLRNPFNALLGLSSLLITSCEEKNYDQVEEFSQLINESSQSAYELLVNLLDWSRVQLGKFPNNPESISIEQITSNIVLLLKSSANSKKITIQQTIQPSINIVADKNMISTVIRNLLSNAIKYSHRESTISVSASIVKNNLKFSITDSGVGIKKEDIAKLFRIDLSHSTPGTEKEIGTGLGLILCKDFIEQHNGKIWVESETGKGSTFYFSLPVNQSKQPTNPQV